MSNNFEDLTEVVIQYNAKRKSYKLEIQTSTSGKDYPFVKAQVLGAIGWVGLEFDNVTQIKNLIEEVTGDYNGRVIDYLESALSRLSQLRFCSLPIHNELENCIASIYDQNRSLKEYVSQLDEYVRLVNETEDTIVEQLSNIRYDCAKPGTIPVYNVPAQHVTVANGSAITMEADANDVKEAEKNSKVALDILQETLDIGGLYPGYGFIPDMANSVIYAARGDKANAALSAFSAVPVFGDIATSGKFIKKGVKVAKQVSETVKIIEKTYKIKRVKATGKVVTKIGDAVEAAKKSKKVVKGSEKAVNVAEGASKTKSASGADKVINTLTDAQKSRLRSLENTIKDHLTEGDFSGTLRDLQGNPVPNKNGGYFDHLGEMKDSYASLIKIRKGLEGSLKNPNLSDVDSELLQEGLDKANTYITRIEELFKPYGGI